MDKKLIENWLKEEKNAHIQGWDFSHIHGRYEEENDLPWDYKSIIKQYLKPEYKLLDIDTVVENFFYHLNILLKIQV